MNVSKENLFEMACQENPEGFEVVESKSCGTWRWGTEHIVIFKHDGRHFRFFYRTQPEMGIGDVNFWSDHETCAEVQAEQVTTTKWVKVAK